jgi:hypothetical protein
VTLDIAASRLHSQRLMGAGFARPEQVVGWMGAVQAQEYADAKWALALRMQRASHAGIERAIANGSILRTHVLRPTWHFVAAGDLRWMLALTGPRVAKALASYYRRLELDASVFRRSQDAFVRALRGGAQLTRQELKGVLQRAGIRADNAQRLAGIVMRAELDGIVCSGARRHKQFTYALVDERVLTSRVLSRDRALAQLTRRYFSSHGPAQLHDFVWWSGLTVADARAGLEMVDHQLASDTIDGRTYWFSASVRALTRPRMAYLLPLYDEFLNAYRDRTAALDPVRWTSITARHRLSAPVVVGSQVIGGWRKTVERNRFVVTVMPFSRLSTRDSRLIARAADALAGFFDAELHLRWE